jgi:hypothetical protein
MACVLSAVGVPEMAQVVEASERPAGRAGLALQPVMEPPVLEGVWVAMAVPLVAVSELGLKVMTGATSLTVRVKEAEACPPELEAVMV